MFVRKIASNMSKQKTSRVSNVCEIHAYMKNSLFILYRFHFAFFIKSEYTFSRNNGQEHVENYSLPKDPYK